MALAAAAGERHRIGFYLAEERQHVDKHTLINDEQPRGTSKEFYRGC